MNDPFFEVGSSIIMQLHKFTADMSPEEAVQFRFSFYRKMIASDLAAFLEPQCHAEVLQELSDSILHLVATLRAEGPIH